MDGEWLSLHVWYHDATAHDSLTLGLVKPLFQALHEQNAILKGFFIRYFDGGPHIRIRVEASPVQKTFAEQFLKTETQRYLADNPSQPGNDSVLWGKAGTPTEPDNTYRFIPYEPEVERYGGTAGIRVAENFFAVSSSTALSVLQRASVFEDPIGAKLAYALQLVPPMVLAAGFRGPLSYRFFEDYLRHVYVAETAEDNYAEVCRRCRPHLVERFRALSLVDLDWALGGDELLSNWGRACADSFSAVRGVLGGGEGPTPDQPGDLGSAKMRFVRIVQSQVHMFLNRLGFWGTAEERILRLCRDAWYEVSTT